MHQWCFVINPLQRNALKQHSFTSLNSHNKPWHVDSGYKREVGHWFNIFGCRQPYVVFMVSYTSKDWQKISMPIFKHRNFELLWCHSVLHLEFDHPEEPCHVVFEREFRDTKCRVCCKYSL